MTRHPLLSTSRLRASAKRTTFGVLALAGALLSGCSDAGTAGKAAVSDAAALSTNAATSSVAKPAVSSPSPGADFASAWGPAVGSTIPMLAANDQTGTPQSLASLAGDKGLLLVFSRSADW